MSPIGATSSQLWPIENFGVVPRLTSVRLSFSPGFAAISATLNFMVSSAVISIGRPSCTGVAGVAADAAGAAAGSLAAAVVEGGAEHAAPDKAVKSANSLMYRAIEYLPVSQSGPQPPRPSLS